MNEVTLWTPKSVFFSLGKPQKTKNLEKFFLSSFFFRHNATSRTWPSMLAKRFLSAKNQNGADNQSLRLMEFLEIKLPSAETILKGALWSPPCFCKHEFFFV